MKKDLQKIVALSITACFLGTNVSLGATFTEAPSDDIASQLEAILQDTQYQEAETAQTKEAYGTIKAGKTLAIELNEPIDSQNLVQGDEITAKLLFPLELNGDIIAPEGATVKGKVKKIEQSGGWFKNALIKIEFTQIECSDDYKLPILAEIKTKDDSGLLLGSSGAERIGKIFSSLATIGLGGALAGFGVGLFSSYALVGAAIGLTIGTTAATGWLFFQKGKTINIPDGTKLIITLKNDVAVSGFEL